MIVISQSADIGSMCDNRVTEPVTRFFNGVMACQHSAADTARRDGCTHFELQVYRRDSARRSAEILAAPIARIAEPGERSKLQRILELELELSLVPPATCFRAECEHMYRHESGPCCDL